MTLLMSNILSPARVPGGLNQEWQRSLCSPAKSLSPEPPLDVTPLTENLPWQTRATHNSGQPFRLNRGSTVTIENLTDELQVSNVTAPSQNFVHERTVLELVAVQSGMLLGPVAMTSTLRQVLEAASQRAGRQTSVQETNQPKPTHSVTLCFVPRWTKALQRMCRY